VDTAGALAAAGREDADAKAGGNNFFRGPMWGVPIVVKANTSIRGLITTDGWKGYMIPGHELVAPKDATIIAKLRAAGALILGQTNMPDLRQATPIAARPTAGREMPMTYASVREGRPAERSPL
jgi:Asp-tRNA(Asn)/Glu-tRNA(Gln) amidotransferase A subunit family amidase